MSRYRTIKPDFWTSSQVISLRPYTRLLFIGIWNFCDDAGRIGFDPQSIKAKVLPGDDVTSGSVRVMLHEIVNSGLMGAYMVDGKPYLYVTGWHHQRIDKPQKPKCPGPDDPKARPIEGPLYEPSRQLLSKFDEPPLPLPEPVVERSSPEYNSERSRRERNSERNTESPSSSELCAAREFADPSGKDDDDRLTPEEVPPEPQVPHEAHAKSLSFEYDRMDRMLRALIPKEVNWPIKNSPSVEPMPELAKTFDFDEEIVPAVLAIFRRFASPSKPFAPRSWGLVADNVRQRIEQKRGRDTSATSPTQPIPAAEINWENLVGLFAKGVPWPPGIGPAPNAPGCQAPAEVLERNGYAGGEPDETPRVMWMRLVKEFLETENWEPNRKLGLGPAPGEPGCECPRDIAEQFGFEVIPTDDLGRPKPKLAPVPDPELDAAHELEAEDVEAPLVNGGHAPGGAGQGGAGPRAPPEAPLPPAVEALRREGKL